MRLWTLHPQYLDSAGLTAVWREALLARHVLLGRTRGYRRHPQLGRFRAHSRPVALVNTYLAHVHAEATRRGYSFDASKIGRARIAERLPETDGQLRYEWRHLRRKLTRRNPAWLRTLKGIKSPLAHPLFKVIPGGIQPWEIR